MAASPNAYPRTFPPTGEMTNAPNGHATSTALIQRADQPGLIFKPRVTRSAESVFRIIGYRDNENVVPWGFWGGLLAVAVGAVVLAWEGLTGLWAFWDLIGALAAVAVGLLMMRFGARTSLTEEPCAEVNVQTRRLRLLTSGEEVALPDVSLDDLEEIVFGMTRYPVSRDRGAVKVEAFSLLVRHNSNTLIPIVEASPDKDELFGVARFLAGTTGLRVTQVGRGVK